LGFALIGIGGSILCMTLFPLIAVFTRNDQNRQNRVRFIIRKTFKFYINCLMFMGVINVKTSNLTKLHDLRGVLVICNHPSLLDVVIIMAHLGNLQCIVKKELWKNPFLGGVVRAAGYIRNDLDPDQFYENCKMQLDRGENILIFPEGTRSVPGVPIKLHRSLANLAFAAKADIQMLTMDCIPSTLVKGDKWYQIPNSCPHFLLKAGKFIKCQDFQSDLPRSLRVRALTRDIQQDYNRCLGHE